MIKRVVLYIWSGAFGASSLLLVWSVLAADCLYVIVRPNADDACKLFTMEMGKDDDVEIWLLLEAWSDRSSPCSRTVIGRGKLTSTWERAALRHESISKLELTLGGASVERELVKFPPHCWSGVDRTIPRPPPDPGRVRCVLTLPLWLPTLLAGTWPVVAFLRGPLRRHRRRRRGRCPSCGYDLTGNVSGVCPEDGTKLVRS